MNHKPYMSGLLAKLLLVLLFLFPPLKVFATVTISDCVIQAPVANAVITSAYLRISYVIDVETVALDLPDPEVMERVEIPALSDDVQIHRTEITDSVASMVRLNALVLEKPETLLEPGGVHLMLSNLKVRPQPGQEYQLKLIFRFEPEHSCVAKVKSMAEIISKK